ncbi:hypothetical protein [Gordonia hankookensis]|uniref:Uncharacterized protein n=1 Tax=Gordonia hankookensis TaxID=589403 RepID=A0ABR7WCM2_9ACTN|nr:hypothetical protein [Gordonia hankookensis]MBD1320542.1 hypothetical protein [Gordonia hankookensis]
MEATDPRRDEKPQLRPYSLKLFLLSVPVSYLIFMIVFWAAGVLPNRGPGATSLGASFAVVSLWYVLSCYVWIPLTWLASSFGIAALRRRAR